MKNSQEIVAREIVKNIFTQNFINNEQTNERTNDQTKRNMKIVSWASLHQKSYNQNHAEILFNLLLNRVLFFALFNVVLSLLRLLFVKRGSVQLLIHTHTRYSIVEGFQFQSFMFSKGHWQKLLCELYPADHESWSHPENHFIIRKKNYWC